MNGKIVILGIFVADTSYRADRMPKMGETILGNSFALGPGGKGSNQAVAAAMASGSNVTKNETGGQITSCDVHFISKLGQDPFGDMAMKIWHKAGVIPQISRHGDNYTGAAFIYVNEESGDNAIIVCPGIAGTISPADIDLHRELIASASVFVTQLEQSMDAAMHALKLARAAGVTTILNPAPAAQLPPGMLELCDYISPNETEAEAICGVKVDTIDAAGKAAGILLEMGVGAAVITLGQSGVYYRDPTRAIHINALDGGKVVETTGAGDAFNGGFAAALARGLDPVEAVKFGNATAAISVTRAGTAPSMPALGEIEALLAKSV